MSILSTIPPPRTASRPRPILKSAHSSVDHGEPSQARGADTIVSPIPIPFTSSPYPTSCFLTRAKTTGSSGRSSASHRVHFPPSPSLTRTHSCYSGAVYDRSPIVVAPNSCGLPERGCPGRTYTLDIDPTEDEDCSGLSLLQCVATSNSPLSTNTVAMGDMHPRSAHFLASTGIYVPLAAADERAELLDKLEAEAEAKELARQESVDSEEDTPIATEPPYELSLLALMPSLIPDLSSESDESDGFVSPPEDGLPFMVGFSPQVNQALLDRSHLSGLSLTNPALLHDPSDPYSYTSAFTQPNSLFNTNYTPHDLSLAFDKSGTDTPTSPSTPTAHSFPIAGPSEFSYEDEDDEKVVNSRERRRTRRRRPSRVPDVPGGNEEDDEAEPEEVARRLALATYRASSFRSSSPLRGSSPIRASPSVNFYSRASSPMRYRPNDALSIPCSPASLPPPSPGFMRAGNSICRSGSPLRGASPVFRPSSWSSSQSNNNFNTPPSLPSSPTRIQRTSSESSGEATKPRPRRNRVPTLIEDGSPRVVDEAKESSPRRRTRPAYRRTSVSMPSGLDDDAGCLGGF